MESRLLLVLSNSPEPAQTLLKNISQPWLRWLGLTFTLNPCLDVDSAHSPFLVHGKLHAMLKTSTGRCYQLATSSQGREWPRALSSKYSNPTAVSCRKSTQRWEKRQEFWGAMCWNKSSMPGWELFTSLAWNYLSLNGILLILIETQAIQASQVQEFLEGCHLVFILRGEGGRWNLLFGGWESWRGGKRMIK